MGIEIEILAAIIGAMVLRSGTNQYEVSAQELDAMFMSEIRIAAKPDGSLTIVVEPQCSNPH